MPESAWAAYGEPRAPEIRECAEVDFVPGATSEYKGSQPLRYVAVRIRQQLC